MVDRRALLATATSRVLSPSTRGPLLLSISQLGVLLSATVAFAVLARWLGPAVFGEFAAVIFIFGISSLLSDLAPQAFLLIHGVNSSTYSAAKLCALISWLCSVILMLGLVAVYSSLSPIFEYDLATCLLLTFGLASQFGMQPSRALLILGHRYGTLAMCDLIGTILGALLAIYLAARGIEGVHVLTAQLGMSLGLRQLFGALALKLSGCKPPSPRSSTPNPPSTPNPHSPPNPHSTQSSLRAGVRFGVSVIPLNVGSYLTRSLDSGLMPLLLPQSTAGVYARSYQLVVVPVSQVQLAVGPWVLGRLGAAARENAKPSDTIFVKVWLALSTVSTAAALTISVASGLIAAVMFGPGWPNASLMLTCMAATLPSLAWNTYFAWITQIFARRFASLAHLGGVLISPLSALLGAQFGGLTGALVGLVLVGGLGQPVVLLFIHRAVLPLPIGKLLSILLAQWSIPAILFGLELFHAQS